MRIIGITGGKGGTGKSTVATALAYRLAKDNKVLLVDADVDCPNDHLLLNIDRIKLEDVSQRIPVWDYDKCTKCGLCGPVCKTNAVVSIKDLNPIFMKNQCNGCGSCVFKCPVDAISWSNKIIGQIYSGNNHNIDFLSGELAINEPVSEFVVNALNKVIDTKRNEYDYIIIDTAAGTHCPVIAALEMCDYIFTVTEPTPLGKHDLEIILMLLKELNKKASIVINRSDIGDTNLIKELSDKYNHDIICSIGYSKDIVDSYANARPIVFDEIKELIGVLK